MTDQPQQPQPPQTIRIESRRMLRDETQRQIWGKQKRQQRHPELKGKLSADCPPNVREASDRCPPLSSSSSSSSKNKNKSADALFEASQEARSKPQRKLDPYELWLTTKLRPAFPIEGDCQQPTALRYLRKEKPPQETLDAYLAQVELWKPEWAANGYQPGLHSFLTDGKYRQAPPTWRPDRNGNGARAEAPGPKIRTWDEALKS